MTSVIIIALLCNIRALLGAPGCCRYTLTCTRFAKIVFKQYPLYKSIPLIIRRVLSCSPLTNLVRRASRNQLVKHRLR